MTIHLRFAASRPETFNAETRTVEAIASTGAESVRPGYRERLDLSGADLARLRGAPVLDGHRAGSTRDQIGVVETAETRPEGLWVRIRFRDTALAREVAASIADGTLRGLSIGYTVQEWRDERESGERIRTATKWTPLEVSVVPIPADPGAHFRAEETSMEQETEEQTLEQGHEETRATRAEINREIRQIAETAGLSRAWADERIDADASAEEARADAFEAMRQRSAETRTRTQRATVGVDHTDPRVRAERMGEALFARAHPDHELSAPARAYAGITFRDAAADCLREAGMRTTGLSADARVTRAQHSTSDYPLVLGDAFNRTFRRAYERAPEGARVLARQTSHQDFREKRAIMLGEGPDLAKVPEGAEYTHGTIAEGGASYALETYGRIFGVTRQVQVNDDLGAFFRVPAHMGQAARAFEAAQIVKLIEDNPAMSDGTPVFHADHANLGTGGTINVTTLTEARLLMRKQTGLSGALIDMVPRFVLVPPELETTAEQALSEIQATKTDDVNPFAALQVVVEPRLSDSGAWYVVADPARADGIEYAYLEGAPGPQIETKAGFEIDGMQIKVRLDFGCGWIDHRSWVKNPGA